MKRLAFAAAVVLAAGSATASDLASSTASSAGSASSGSVSNSLQGSSGSSAQTVAEGEYRIVDVAEAPQRPGDLRLTLERDDRTIVLTLSRQAVEAGRLARGDRVAATHRPYGVEFSAVQTREAFFLVLDDAWQRGLRTVPVPG